jgi:hypothetical protein
MGSRGSQRNFKASAVDESLFAGGKNANKENTAIVNMEEIRAIRAKATANKASDSAVISNAELLRIRNACKIVSKEEKKEQHNLMKQQQD